MARSQVGFAPFRVELTRIVRTLTCSIRAAQAHFDRVLITTPDRLACKYIYQMFLIEELEKGGCLVEFLERPCGFERAVTADLRANSDQVW